MSPQVLSPLSSQRDSFQYKYKHVTLLHKFQWLPITLSLYPKSYHHLTFDCFSDIFHCPHIIHIGFVLHLLCSLSRMLFLQVITRLSPILHVGLCSDYNLVGKPSLNTILSVSSLPYHVIFFFYSTFFPPPAPQLLLFATGFKWFIWVSIYFLSAFLTFKPHKSGTTVIWLQLNPRSLEHFLAE